ncbi:MAG: serine hydrolase domain-containing protein, partial [Bacteroidota bacterium]
MKKNRITFYQTMLIILAISLIGCTTENSPLRDDIDNKRYADLLEERLSDLPPDAEVAIALVQEGQVEYIGVLNQNGVLRGTANANHIFEIGSITKVFTGISLSALISEQRAALNDRVEDQLGYPLRAGGGITLAQLATHTSGLPSLPTNVDEVKDFDIMDPYASY